MDFNGLIRKFRINRPLTNWERTHQLHTDRSKMDEPNGRDSVIKMNSTYLECVDKFFEAKGIVTSGGFLGIGVIAFGVWATTSVLFMIFGDEILTEQEKMMYGLFFILGIGVLLFIAYLFFRGLRREIFSLTHWPIRFNRKNRMVYVTRLDGLVMGASWDEIFFAEGDCGGDGTRDVRGHILDDDGETVLETFALPFYADKSYPRRHAFWEFARRYMENGPAELMNKVGRLIDVDDRRERFGEGFMWHHRFAMNHLGMLGLLIIPISLFYAIGRWIAVHTSKIPQWPAEVEAECRIDPYDRYIVDRKHPPLETL